MNPLKTVLRRGCDGVVNLAPSAFLDSLRRNHYDLVAADFNRAYLFDWAKAKVPRKIEDFADLAGLFGLTPLARGIIRQDVDEAAALFKAIKELPEPQGVEIGRFNGGSTLLLAVAVGPKGKILSIDISPQDDATLDCILQRAQVRQRVELVIGDANKVERDQSFDFAFIDGDHSYDGAKRDHNRWGRKTREGGLIIHHDMASSRRFATQWNELAQLRADILSKQRDHLELVDEVGSLSIFRKRNGSWTDI